ncbi:DNA-directed RNA polymerases I and III subunit RPAC2 isoform X1 [Amborella trichopoda]|uniref:DNA-directed RNA polymerases I and III subunit RPAC2 isoform X1 n=1 Tax=Amborella trichopoda TaxID=13333 RepID=UPI0009C0DA17|nr:DNA-directed RNA polymerases I and III subunit RPAC2 isoform X1 [Amborella trichopoda]|eukprot:XP_020531802.1 DNA-directed RNA polymerases I and III subunit RPAC2 isoform X1 [Amborella trichopoda]
MAHHHLLKGMAMKGVGPVPGSYPVVVVRIFFASLSVTSMDGDGPNGPRTSFCGYSIPHPSENRVNIRVQTTGDPAKDVFKDALQDLMSMCQHVRGTFDKAVIDFKKKGAKGGRQRNTKGGDREKVVRKAVGDMNID